MRNIPLNYLIFLMLKLHVGEIMDLIQIISDVKVIVNQWQKYVIIQKIFIVFMKMGRKFFQVMAKIKFMNCRKLKYLK